MSITLICLDTANAQPRGDGSRGCNKTPGTDEARLPRFFPACQRRSEEKEQYASKKSNRPVSNSNAAPNRGHDQQDTSEGQL